jgi:hypothetical protein
MPLERICALLAKAERTDNAHEAQAYLMKAQALATGRQRGPRAGAGSPPRAASSASSRRPGRSPSARRASGPNQHLIALFIAIAHANDAHVDIAAEFHLRPGLWHARDLDVIEAMYPRSRCR